MKSQTKTYDQLLGKMLTAWALLLLPTLTSATTIAPPSFKEVVQQATWIGKVYIEEAKVLTIEFEGERANCGGKYKAIPREVFLGGPVVDIAFFSRETLEIDSEYMIYLAEEDLTPKIMSTNSLSKPGRRKRQRQSHRCQQASGLPFTLRGSSSKFSERRLIDRDLDSYEDWMSTPWFRPHVPRMVFVPTQIMINGEHRDKDELLEQRFDRSEKSWDYPSTDAISGQSLVHWPSYKIKLQEIVSNPNSIKSRRVKAAATIGGKVFFGGAGTELPSGRIGSLRVDYNSYEVTCSGNFLFLDQTDGTAIIRCYHRDNDVQLLYLTAFSEGFLTGEIRGTSTYGAVQILYGQSAEEMNARLDLPIGKMLKDAGELFVLVDTLEP